MKHQFEVINGDCRAELRKLRPASCALLLTDVPYAVSRAGEDEDIQIIGRKAMKRHFGEWDRAQDLASILSLIRAAAQTSADVVHPRGAAYVFASDAVFGTVRDALVEYFRPQQAGHLVWTKTNPSPSVRKARWTSASELVAWCSRPGHRFGFPGHRDSFTWFAESTVHHAHRTHPNEKPVRVWQRIIAATTQPGDVVLDPFCGTASSGEAALRLGRRFIGIELDSGYAAIAARRLMEVQRAVANRRGA